MERRITEALKMIPRECFLPDGLSEEAEVDVPLPIGFGQTNSQPSTVELMLEWLEVEPGMKVLDVGSGSGWTSALLAYLTGAEGEVVAVEIVPELVEFGRENCEKLAINNIDFHLAGKVPGWPFKAPYDRILVSAASGEIPQELIEQLAPKGRMVIPVNNSVDVIEKDSRGRVITEDHPGFAFVPLV